MRIVRYREGDRARIGAVTGDGVVDLIAAGSRWTSVRDIAVAGEEAIGEISALVASQAPTARLTDLVLLPPIERPGKYLAIGMNYAKHIEEAKRLGVSTPNNQFWFNKQTSCVAGPFDDIDPGVTERLDYEVELGVVVGKAAKRVSETQARDHVFGYVVANDVSARDWQQHSPTFTLGKSFDTHGPIGPCVVTADEIADPHRLRLRCWVNGELRQDSDTSELVYDVWQQIAYLSTAFTLEPGDLLATGTPSGVGVGMQPPRFLQPGDVVRCEIDGIGVIENRVADPAEAQAWRQKQRTS